MWIIAKRTFAQENFGKKEEKETYEVFLLSRSDKQEKGQDCSYNFRANSAFLSILVSMVFSVLENWKEKGRFDLLCTKVLFYHIL